MTLPRELTERSATPSTGRTVLLADDDSSIRTVLSQALTREGFRVRATSAPGALWRWVSEGEGDLVITDVYMEDESIFDLLPRIRAARPDLPVIVVSAQNNVLTAAAAIEHGAFDYLPKPFDLDQLLLTANRAATKSTAKANSRAGGRDGGGQDEPVTDPLPMIGRSPAMQEVYRIIARVMNTDLTVLLTGEPGTGKALTARLIHDLSRRRGLPFSTINLAAISGNAVERTLFGVDGDPKHGQLAETHSGTLYLQSVDALGPGVQTRLSAWLAERERMLASHPGTFCAPRLIVDADQDLAEAVADGRFRSELYWRLNVVSLRLPPLRERDNDASDLARAFLARHEPAGSVLVKKSFEPEALELLKRHSWPGNVRELENLVRRLAALNPGQRISALNTAESLHLRQAAAENEEDLETRFAAIVADILPGLLAVQQAGTRGSGHKTGLHDAVFAALERPLLRLVLGRTRGNKLRAAEILGLNRNTLRARIVALGLEGSPDND